MRHLGRILLIIVAVLVVAFAIANRGPVTLNFWPLPFAATVPLYLVMLGALALGVAVGGIATWVRGGRWRKRARAAERESKALADRLAGERVEEARRVTAGSVPASRYRPQIEDE
jgi:uncharacterized integral membrane protein